MSKSFEQWLKENRSRYPTVWRKLERDKQRFAYGKKQERKRLLWAHGVRSFGPPRV